MTQFKDRMREPNEGDRVLVTIEHHCSPAIYLGRATDGRRMVRFEDILTPVPLEPDEQMVVEK
jgi:hypothetical protein